MSKKVPIPPIRPNPRYGKEKATDASVVWGGAQPPKQTPVDQVKSATPARSTPAKSKRSKRKTRQRSIAIMDEEQLKQLQKRYNQDTTGVVNLALAELAARGLTK